MLQETQEKVREIKRSFRQLMNGVTSQSMREKGLSYKINWGVAYTDLKNMAAEYGKDYSLAIELWKENIRECKILATMIMPPEEMSAEVVDLWLEQAPTQEIVEMLAFNLLQYLPYVPVMAYEWIASDIELRQIAGYLVLARLFMRGETPDERGMNEIIDQATTALRDNSIAIRHAAFTCLQRLAQVEQTYCDIVNKALRHAGLENFTTF
ncbi:MAG: DNA alkylation repair protein [Prevotella sp.]|nr:DNA alkylation repair protein [Prevotella sp.]